MIASVQADAPEARIKELDGWRAISVLLVILAHLGAYRFGHLVSPHRHVFVLATNIGLLGVKVFFLISGFVICRLLILEERRFGSASLSRFYVRRVFRIIPPFFFYLAVVCLLFSLQMIVGSWRAILNAALFLYDFRLIGNCWSVAHTWSLAVEEQFYLIFPTLWMLTRKGGRERFFPLVLVLLVAWNLLGSAFDWNQYMLPPVRAGFACIALGVVMAIFERHARA